MAITPMQKSFHAGEWSPLLNGRTDLQKYYSACAVLKNMVPLPQGPVTYCPGFRYVKEVKNSSKETRIVPFIFSATVAYALEFGDQYVRFFKYDSNGEPVQIQSGGSPLEVQTDYLESELFELKFTQKGDMLYIFHKQHAPHKLIRISDTVWSISDVGFWPGGMGTPSITPQATLCLDGSTGSITINSKDSCPSGNDINVFLTGDVGKYIMNTSGAGKALIISVPNQYTATAEVMEDFDDTVISSGDWLLYGGPSGQIAADDTGAPGRTITIKSTGSDGVLTHIGGGEPSYWISSGGNEYYLSSGHPNHPGTAYGDKPDGVYENGGEMYEGTRGSLGIHQWDWSNAASGYYTIHVRLIDNTDPNTLDAGDIQYMEQVNIYELFRDNATQGGSDEGKYISVNDGLVSIRQVISATEAVCEVIRPLSSKDETVSWSMYQDVWNDIYGYPVDGEFHEERLWLVRGNNIWGSATADYENFGPGSNDADAVSYLIDEASEIVWIKKREYLMVGTTGEEWRVSSSNAGSDPLTPTNVSIRHQTSYGSADLEPLSIEDSILFLERLGTRVRELTYQWESNGFTAPDLTVLAKHITEGGGIRNWAYQPIPYQIVWAVRQDGTLIALTYNRGEQVVAWSRRVTDGKFESVAAIPGPDDQHEVWAVVNRTIGGQTKRYIEVMAPFVDEDDATYQQNNGINSLYLDSVITVENPATRTITGLGHLEGKEVSILADGAAHPKKTVSSGSVTLDYDASVVHAGLGYEGDVQTMRFEVETAEGTSQALRVSIPKVHVRLYRSMGMEAGPDGDHLDPVPFRNAGDSMDSPPPLFTGDMEVSVPTGYNDDMDMGQVFIRHASPTPFTLVAVMPEMEVGG